MVIDPHTAWSQAHVNEHSGAPGQGQKGEHVEDIIIRGLLISYWVGVVSGLLESWRTFCLRVAHFLGRV